MSAAPTLSDLFRNPRIKGLSFWCNDFACQYHEVFPVGPMAIDYGPGLMAALLRRFGLGIDTLGTC